MLTDAPTCPGPVLLWRAPGSWLGECGACGAVLVAAPDDRHADTPVVLADD